MRRLRFLFALGAGYFGLCLLAGAYLVDRSMQRRQQPVTASDRTQAADLARTLGAELDFVSIDARDGVSLRGWLFSPARPASGSILLLHGIAANRAALLPSVPLFVEQGYRALAVDLRAHGDSGGGLETFGALETDDVERWIAWLRGRQPGGCVYAVGSSLGAGFAVQAANSPGLCAIIAESAFESLREVAFDRIGERLRAGPWVGRLLLRPGVELGFLYARLRHGVNLGRPSAAAAVSGGGVPVLLIQDLADDNTPLRHARLIQAANPNRVSLWLVPGALHGGARQAAPSEYRARVLDFLASHQSPQG